MNLTLIQVWPFGVSFRAKVMFIIKARTPVLRHQKQRACVWLSYFQPRIVYSVNHGSESINQRGVPIPTPSGATNRENVVSGQLWGFCRPARCPGPPSPLTSHLSVSPLSSSALILSCHGTGWVGEQLRHSVARKIEGDRGREGEREMKGGRGREREEIERGEEKREKR